MMTKPLERLHELDRIARRASNISSLLQWDQETCLPEKAVEGRAEQLADIEGIVHDRTTDPELGRLLLSLGSTTENPGGDESLPALDRDFLRVMRLDYDRNTKIPKELAVSMARDEGLSQDAWVHARKANDFSAFEPHLTRMIAYAKKKAEYWGFAEHPYDGLLDEHERGMTESMVDGLFTPLKKRLVSLVERIGKKTQIDKSFLQCIYPVDAQDAFGRTLMRDLGLDVGRGRLDLSAHPFTTTLGVDDVRITTRYFPGNMLSGLFSIIHETGHAMYEQGFGVAIRSTSLAEGASMGVHESQSRLWENVIGRSRAFWDGRFPALQTAFPTQLGRVSPDAFYRAVNVVEPSLIRVDADEVTYSLHIILRFELERKLFNGTLAVKDLPAEWNRAMKDILGVVPANDADGVLQDVHWSIGAFGYFPSYALGNIYGLQLWNAMRRDLPGVDGDLRDGRYQVPLTWFRHHIHEQGRRFPPAELVRSVCGESIDSKAFIDYLETKYTELYGL